MCKAERRAELIKSSEYADENGLSLTSIIEREIIPGFRTKKQAEAFAEGVGWRSCHVMRIERRFETLWHVGQCISNELHGRYRFPAGLWLKNDAGTQYMKCVEVSIIKAKNEDAPAHRGDSHSDADTEMASGSSNTLCAHRMQMHIKCTDEDADALRRLLAATVFDRYEMNGPKAVFSVNVEPDISISTNEYVIALCMSELEKGLNSKQINRLLTILPESGTYMPIEFHAANISAYGFISVEYYKSCDYDDAFLDLFDDVLEEMSLESPDVVYEISDGRKLYMGYLKEGQCE